MLSPEEFNIYLSVLPHASKEVQFTQNKQIQNNVCRFQIAPLDLGALEMYGFHFFSILQQIWSLLGLQ